MLTNLDIALEFPPVYKVHNILLGNAVRMATHVRRYRGSLNNISGAKYDLEKEGDPY